MKALNIVKCLALAIIVAGWLTAGIGAPGRAHAVTVFTVTTTADVGAGSLRAAITAANATPNSGGRDEIHFNISGGGTPTIVPATALPTITEAVWIRGDTQPSCAVPCIILNGGGAAFDGITVGSDDNWIRQLVIQRFSNGVYVDGDNNLVGENRIGTNAAGTSTSGTGNSSAGVRIFTGNNNDVHLNVISGNATGVLIEGSSAGATMNELMGNFIGSDPTGMSALSNSGNGVWLNNASNNLVRYNVISANGRGVLIRDDGDAAPASANTVDRNRIGVTVNFTGAIGNAAEGIRIEGGDSNVIGGTSIGEPNVIAYNGADGIAIVSSGFAGTGTMHTVRNNSIHSNGGLGIDLGDDGATANDAGGDGDGGPNLLQNHPMVIESRYNAISGATNIEFNIETTPNTAIKFEFFASDSCDPSLHGEGTNFLYAPTLTTDGAGVLPGLNVAVIGGDYTDKQITATAMDPSGSTSEFSSCVPVLCADNDLAGGPFGGTQPWIADGTGPEGANIGCNSIDINDDNDLSCTDGEETGGSLALGGMRNPVNPWDFADVPTPALPMAGAARNGAIALTDVGAALTWVGTTNGGGLNPNGRDYDNDDNANGVEDGAEYDRTPGGQISGPPNGAVSLSDVGVILNQVGDSCVAAPN